MTIVPIDLDLDYGTLVSWWQAHGANPSPRVILPRGWFARDQHTVYAASFLYLDPGKIGVIEFTTTNPFIPPSRETLEAVKALYDHLQEVARSEGCRAIISFVKPKSSEERIMSKMGFATSDDDPGHKLFAKPLHNIDQWKVPEGGVLQCPSR